MTTIRQRILFLAAVLAFFSPGLRSEQPQKASRATPEDRLKKLEERADTLVAALVREGTRFGLAWLYLSAGRFTVLQGEGASALAAELAAGPTFGNAMTKRMLEMEWAMSVETAIEAEAVAQALCMETEDFARAFRAFADKRKPVFEGN